MIRIAKDTAALASVGGFVCMVAMGLRFFG
ncbi:hypothetical protein BH09PSE2_BH09PSE2_14150 [soil metagenome]